MSNNQALRSPSNLTLCCPAASGISPVLRMVKDLPLITNSECNSIYGIVGDGVVCMDTAGGKGTCNGDSGGPLGHYDEARERWLEVGIVSFGASSGCEVKIF